MNSGSETVKDFIYPWQAMLIFIEQMPWFEIL